MRKVFVDNRFKFPATITVGEYLGNSYYQDAFAARDFDLGIMNPSEKREVPVDSVHSSKLENSAIVQIYHGESAVQVYLNDLLFIHIRSHDRYEYDHTDKATQAVKQLLEAVFSDQFDVGSTVGANFVKVATQYLEELNLTKTQKNAILSGYLTHLDKEQV